MQSPSMFNNNIQFNTKTIKMISLNNKQINLSTQSQAIVHFIETMDIEMIDAFLDDDKTYQDFKKYIFISKLQEAFEKFANFGDTNLISVAGRCTSCDKTKSGFLFIGNNSNNYMNLIFDTANGKVNDLYECRNFKNQHTDLELNTRIYLEEVFPF